MEEITNVPPGHPADFLNYWLMPAQSLTREDLARETGLASETVNGLLDGKIPVTRSIAIALSKPFGHAAETVYRMQAELNIYEETGEIPSSDQLPKLDPI